jgi:hypothetical protein
MAQLAGSKLRSSRSVTHELHPLHRTRLASTVRVHSSSSRLFFRALSDFLLALGVRDAIYFRARLLESPVLYPSSSLCLRLLLGKLNASQDVIDIKTHLILTELFASFELDATAGGFEISTSIGILFRVDYDIWMLTHMTYGSACELPSSSTTIIPPNVVSFPLAFS